MFSFTPNVERGFTNVFQGTQRVPKLPSCQASEKDLKTVQVADKRGVECTQASRVPSLPKRCMGKRREKAKGEITMKKQMAFAAALILVIAAAPMFAHHS